MPDDSPYGGPPADDLPPPPPPPPPPWDAPGSWAAPSYPTPPPPFGGGAPPPYDAPSQAAPPPGWGSAPPTYPPAGYPNQPAWGGGYGGYGQPPQTEQLATVALVMSIASFAVPCLSILLSIPALVLSFRAKRYIALSQGMKSGGGMATAATIISIINICLVAAAIVGFIALLATGNFDTSSSSDNFNSVLRVGVTTVRAWS